MSQQSTKIVGQISLKDEDGLRFSFQVGKSGNEKTVWFEALPDWASWPGLGKYPDKPKHGNGPHYSDRAARSVWHAKCKEADEEWQRNADEYKKTLHNDPTYKEASRRFVELQSHEPQRLVDGLFWAYRGYVLRIESSEPETLRYSESEALFVKHFVLRRERNYERVKREVQALENLEKLSGSPREPIPEAVRLFVWQRDEGQCVKCGSRERLEFDHIIPVIRGGSSTERNVQLLCESCNRSKGAAI